jgi:SNF2 family DNA or RNA helicase
MTGLAPVALAKHDLLVLAVTDGRRLGLQFGPSVEEVGKRVKPAGAVWFAPRRLWVVRNAGPERASAWIRQLFADQAAAFDLDGVERTVRAGTASIEADYFTQLLDVQIFPLASTAGGTAVSFVYDLSMVDAMRALGGRFHKFAAAWELRCPRDEIMRALQEVAGVGPEFVFIHERPVVLEQLAASGKSEAPITVAAASPPQLGGGTGDDDKAGTAFMSTLVEPMAAVDVDDQALQAAAQHAGMRDYQVVGARHLLSWTGALLADDMGLGKSRQAVVASRLAAGAGRVLIVCPASLRINWEREILAVYPQAVIGMVGEDRITTLYGCQWIIANYERLGGLVREVDLAIEVLTVDEAHYLKEHEAGRTRNAFILAERIPRRFLLTGTPLLSREVELHTLLRLSGHALGRMELKQFRATYAGHSDKRNALASQLKHWMLRRRKDVLTDLGRKHHQVRYVSPAEGRAAYDEVMANMTLMVMPKIVKLRQTLEALKTEFLIETVQGLARDDKIIIFAEYMSTVTALKEALATLQIGAVSLVGSDAALKRQRAVDAFQTDPAIKVFIGTTSAAGVGITLTAANYVTFASEPWTPALKRQAEDRAYRLGQKRDVFVIVPLIPNTIDEQVHQLLEVKTALEQDVVEAVRAKLTA